MKKITAAAALLGAALILCSCGKSTDSPAAQQAEPAVRVEGRTMGTFYALTVLPGKYDLDEQKLRQDAEEQFKYVSDAISSFDVTSEIARFNNWQSTEPMLISNYLGNVIEEVNNQARRIDGVLDLSIAPLVNLWGFGPDGRPNRVPDSEAVAEAGRFVGMDKYKVSYIGGQAFLQKTDPRVKLDLSTVGEGLGVDRLASKLDEAMISNYLVSIAGAVRTSGHNPQGRDWRVGIVNPENPDGQPLAIVCPQGMAMSTSGSYRNYFVDEETGKRYSHIIDPRTAAPIDHHTVSVTVIERTALITDTLDTGLMVMGADEALQWGDSHETAVYVIEMKDGKPQGRYNRYFAPYLKCDGKDPQ